MEPLFKNKTTLSKKNYIELVKFHQKKNNWKYFLYTAFYAILFVFCIAIQIASKYYLPAIILFLCFVGFLAYRFIEPYYKTKKEFQSEKVQKNLVNFYLFYEKYFKIKNKMGSFKLKYHKIYKAYENENFFYLYINKDYAFILEKSGFITGNENDFRKFIKSKLGFKFKEN